MPELYVKHCIACERGTPPLPEDKIAKLLKQIDGWTLRQDNSNNACSEIVKDFKFKNFLRAMFFVNAVAYIAEQEGHHPDMEVGWGYCKVRFTTHAAKGLTENDFICAAKVDKLIEAARL